MKTFSLSLPAKLIVILSIFAFCSCGSSGGSDETTSGDTAAAPSPASHPGTVVAGHLAAAAFNSIPDSFISLAQSNYHVFYGHTSHGSQILTGLEMLQNENSNYAYNLLRSSLSFEEDWTDLGHNGDLSWVNTTRDALAGSSSINVVMWSWCAGASDNSSEGISSYLNAMNQLESEYPNVLFIYMTGHLDGSGEAGNLRIRNNQIRDYCRANGKVLYDFADIESYDPDGNYYSDGTDWCEWCEGWCSTHTCASCDDCAHSQCINCYQKGRAFWWMMARAAGWGG